MTDLDSSSLEDYHSEEEPMTSGLTDEASHKSKLESKVGPIFDSSAEAAKSVVRELFMVQAWALDGASAAILHLTQSSRLSNYMTRRR